AIGPYMAKNLGCYKCPSDNYIGPFPPPSSIGPRLRSVSMNSFIGDYIGKMADFGNGSYRVYNKITQFAAPGPSTTFVFLDECPDSINDGLLQVNMTVNTWSDIVGSLHCGGGGLSFADGHAETHKWQDALTKAPVRRASCPA